MRQLSARDAAYLYLDDGHTSATVLSCWVLSTADGSPSTIEPNDIVERLTDLVNADALFASRLRRLPLDIGLPYWQYDPTFRVAEHLDIHRNATTWTEAQDLLAHIAGDPLDLTRPLWKAHIITDVRHMPDCPGVATIVAIMFHHAAFDGVTWARLTRAILADHSHLVEEPANPARSESSFPTTPRLVALEILRLPRNVFRFAAALIGLVGKPQHTSSSGQDPNPTETTGAPASWPATRFNSAVRGARRVDYCILNLTDVKMIKTIADGATVNDVMISIVGRALHLYLEKCGEPPQRSLSALVPMSTRTGDGGTANQFVPLVVDMHSAEADVATRLAAIVGSSTAAKSSIRSASQKPGLVQAVPAPLLRLIGSVSRAMSARTSSPTTAFANTVIANVHTKTPIETMFGRTICAAFGIQTLGPPSTLAHSISSIDGHLAISVTVDGAVMPDTAEYVRLIRISFDEHLIGARRTVSAPHDPEHHLSRAVHGEHQIAGPEDA
ncbi:wax ester/triacylglycerol synthase domain-containing protein [Williamsia phyllosphaerae]|uniref:diacylglycerol O-acyltransferase n=1 Tax=Williamsia phyllosphaerae TaxID=885042 RepID=A0ABQ1UI26_9NOCA|nr:wax ester/triacylglycerol synthase domain-containing protein [Williamsia phyllosphaerae]GGF19575.1 diacylglycerol O-acyltransferase [Williamsia phyllosphaerae]